MIKVSSGMSLLFFSLFVFASIIFKFSTCCAAGVYVCVGHKRKSFVPE